MYVCMYVSESPLPKGPSEGDGPTKEAREPSITRITTTSVNTIHSSIAIMKQSRTRPCRRGRTRGWTAARTRRCLAGGEEESSANHINK